MVGINKLFIAHSMCTVQEHKASALVAGTNWPNQSAIWVSKHNIYITNKSGSADLLGLGLELV